MDKQIRHQFKINKIREMKNPTILMNEKDFETFKEELEAKINNYEVGPNPTYEGIPIKTNKLIEEGNIIVYDDVLQHTNKLTTYL